MNVTVRPDRPLDRPVVARGDPMNPLETLVQARLDDIHADANAAQWRRAAARRGAAPGGDLRRGLRIRIGHGLVAVGAALAGEERQAGERRSA
jgi:hypothetical protein